MKRVVILGRGAAGKSTLARKLHGITGLPLIELDKIFWAPDLTPRAESEWARMQESLAEGDEWIMDGDIGAFDVVAPRLGRADTVIVLDFSLARCAWNALRRSPERTDFWRWVIAYRRVSLPRIKQGIAAHAPRASVYVLRNSKAVDRFLESQRVDEATRSSAHN